MARKRSRMTILKRQRELRKAEKAARKRARRHGIGQDEPAEPRPTVESLDLLGLKSTDADDTSDSDAEERSEEE